MVGTVIIQTGKFSVLVFSLAMVGTVIIQTGKFSVLVFSLAMVGTTDNPDW